MQGDSERAKRRAGALVGVAVGDSLGLAVEGTPGNKKVVSSLVSWMRTQKKPPQFESYWPLGQISDDTQLTRLLFVACMAKAGESPETVAMHFAQLLVAHTGKWVGLGMATSKALTRLARLTDFSLYLDAASPDGEAGNGPAVRAVAVGVANVGPLVAAEQSRVTHKDPRCAAGSVLVSDAVTYLIHHGGLGVKLNVDEFLQCLAPSKFPELERLPRLIKMRPAKAAKEIMSLQANDGSVGISGFVVSTVLWALYCFLHSPSSFVESFETCLEAGGDTDSTCALTCGLSGAWNSIDAIPKCAVRIIHDQEEKEDLQRDLLFAPYLE